MSRPTGGSWAPDATNVHYESQKSYEIWAPSAPIFLEIWSQTFIYLLWQGELTLRTATAILGQHHQQEAASPRYKSSSSDDFDYQPTGSIEPLLCSEFYMPIGIT